MGGCLRAKDTIAVSHEVLNSELHQDFQKSYAAIRDRSYISRKSPRGKGFGKYYGCLRNQKNATKIINLTYVMCELGE